TEKVQYYGLQALQLHGNESPEFCRELQIKFPEKEIFKVFSVGENFDFSPLKDYLEVVDAFLFDTKGKHHGGNGTVFNWELLTDYP
ncbi:phosphoribosylanthranilate isomerase, partial [Xenorhabdus bovienii]|uniref:phosphoribosylanthranilate isomerase n=1 Tax=Xenorhabdus bovienii TaxID=40576 RepID=UPI003F689752